jgi:hypothetical protein
MFSSGQVLSKEWLISELYKIDNEFSNKSFSIAGCWFGTLGLMLKYKFPSIRITLLDIDERCEKFIHKIVYDIPAIKAITADMYEYSYNNDDVIINTSCEHIEDIQEWLNRIPHGKLVVLQSNDYKEGNGHINCSKNIDDFIEKVKLNDILYSGSLTLPMYTRFMIIGKT